MGSTIRVVASAPGKTILIGEHSAVYGRPALVAAIDRRITVEVEETAKDGVEIDLLDLAQRGEASWSGVFETARRARAAWEAYDATPSPEAFARLESSDPARLVTVALAEGLREANVDGVAAPSTLPALRLLVRSDVPVGAGFGSSAALAVAVVQGVRRLLDLPASPADVFDRALDVERRQHGRPSGVDVAATLHGGVLATRRIDGELHFEPRHLPEASLRRFRLYFTGTPGETTGEVVSDVARRLAETPSLRRRLLDEMAAATEDLEAALRQPDRPESPLDPIRRFQRCLESLGVVPLPVQEFVRAVEAAGGAAKISGAGSLTGPGAGALLVYHPQSQELSVPENMHPIDAVLGARGVSVRREA